MTLSELNLRVGWAVFIGLVAAVEDLRRRQIPNWIPVGAIAGGIGIAVFEKGLAGLGSAVAGTVAGFAVFFALYVLGAMGGGDVKLMAGFGALLGWSSIWEASLWTAAVGGFLALGFAGVSAMRGKTGSRADVIPYAPAIAAGCWLALIPK
jgi:prepilin peptidase CpaA